jgi:hypothetical protein
MGPSTPSQCAQDNTRSRPMGRRQRKEPASGLTAHRSSSWVNVIAAIRHASKGHNRICYRGQPMRALSPNVLLSLNGNEVGPCRRSPDSTKASLLPPTSQLTPCCLFRVQDAAEHGKLGSWRTELSTRCVRPFCLLARCANAAFFSIQHQHLLPACWFAPVGTLGMTALGVVGAGRGGWTQRLLRHHH